MGKMPMAQGGRPLPRGEGLNVKGARATQPKYANGGGQMETLSEGRLGNGRLDHDDNRHGLAAKILPGRRVGKLLTAVLAGLLLPVCAEARVAKGQTGNFIATFGGDQLVPGRPRRQGTRPFWS